MKTVDILDLFIKHHNELGISDITKLTGFPKTTVFRLVNTMEQIGFLDKNIQSKKYKLGMKLFQYGSLYKDQIDLRKISLPYMKMLSELFDETVNLNVLKHGKRVCIECIESKRIIRNFVEVGLICDLKYGASGKSMLAFLSQEAINHILDECTEEVRIKKMDDLKEIRLKGYALSHSERAEGASSISCPIFNSDKQVEGSITVSGPTIRFTEELIVEIKKKLLQLSREISIKNGAVF